MKRRRHGIIFLSSCLLLAACQEASTVKLFNNTSTAVVVTSCEGSAVLPAATTYTLNLSICWKTPEVKIETTHNSWTYSELLSISQVYVSNTFRRQRLPMGIVYYAQLESDGIIFVLPSSATLPAENVRALLGTVKVNPISSANHPMQPTAESGG